MAQNRDLKTRAQIQRELLKLTREEEALRAKIARYEKEGVENLDEEKKEYAELKKKLEDFGKTAKKVNDGRTKGFKAARKAAEDFGKSISTKVVDAFNDLDKASQDVFDQSVDEFSSLAQAAAQFADSTEKGADRAAQLASEIADLQVEVMQAGAGFRNLSDDQAEALSEKIKELQEDAEHIFQGAFAIGGDMIENIFNGMKKVEGESKGVMHAAKGFAEQLGFSLDVTELLQAAILALGSAIQSAARQAQKFQQELGVSNAIARQQIFSFKNIGLSILGLNDDLSEVNIALGAATNSLNDAVGNSKNLSNNLMFIARDTGASETSLAAVNNLMQNIAGVTAEQASQLQLGLVAMAETANVIPGQVLEDMATNAETLAKFSDGTATGMARAAIQAQKLGLNLAKAGQIADSLLSLESSIASEFEASVLIGRELNFDRARNLALNNDIEGAMKEIVDQLGSEEEFLRLNAIQRQALADSIGVGVEDLAEMMKRGGEGATEIDMGLKLQKQANKTLKDILLQIGPGMVETIVGTAMKAISFLFGLKILDNFLGPGSFAGKMLQGIAKFTKPIGAFLGKFAGFLAPLIDIARFVFGDREGRESASASIGFGAAGAGIGAIFGGPVGAAIGYGIGSLVGFLVNEIFPQVGAMVAKGINSAIDAAKNVYNAAISFTSNTIDATMTKVQEIKTKISGFFTNVKDATMTGATNLKAKAGDILVTVTESFTKVKDTVIEGITNVFNKMIAAAKEQINNLTSFLGFKLFDEEEPAVSGGVSQDFIMRPGQGIQRFSGGDTVAGVKDPAMFAALAGNRGMSETGTKQVALLQALVNNSNAQMSEIIRTNKEITAAVNNIGRSTGA